MLAGPWEEDANVIQVLESTILAPNAEHVQFSDLRLDLYHCCQEKSEEYWADSAEVWDKMINADAFNIYNCWEKLPKTVIKQLYSVTLWLSPRFGW